MCVCVCVRARLALVPLNTQCFIQWFCRPHYSLYLICEGQREVLRYKLTEVTVTTL
jgi:hypothetical protein